MASPDYPAAPLKTDKMPPGVPFIVGNEAAERFSYYGMNSILVIFMTKYLLCTYLVSVALGNVFTAAVSFLIQNKDGTVKLAGASYFFFFVIVMSVTAVLFVFFARFYKGKTYIQDEAVPHPV